MKTITVAYMAERDGEEGEACMSIQVTDMVAEVLLESWKAAEKLGLQMQVETILAASELLKGRRYVPGSIKGFREGGAAHDGQGDGDSEKRTDCSSSEK